MVSFLAHMAVGALIAELILRLRTKDHAERTENRMAYWSVGAIAGLIPDLDVIPALIIGADSYAFHHTYTHTFLAIGIVAILCLVIFRKNLLALPLFAGFGMHLAVDYIDNSITPLGHFLPDVELGLLSGWGVMPGSWSSNFWTMDPYKNHYLWSIFLNNGWGLPFGKEFLSYYDLALITILGVLLVIFILLGIQKIRKRSETKSMTAWGFFAYIIRPLSCLTPIYCINNNFSFFKYSYSH